MVVVLLWSMKYDPRLQTKEKSICRNSCTTAIDPATGWFECVLYSTRRIHTHCVGRVLNAFNNNCWLCRYPRPRMIRFHNGTEFKSGLKRCVKSIRWTRSQQRPTIQGLMESLSAYFIANTPASYPLKTHAVLASTSTWNYAQISNRFYQNEKNLGKWEIKST
jgi:hypothetical protein